MKAKVVLGVEISTRKSKIANYSVRKPSISCLHDQNIDPNVSQLSGHKNIESLKSYHSASKQQQEQMSDLIAQNCSSKNPMPDGPIQCLFESVDVQQFDAMFSGANITNCNFNFNANVSSPKSKLSRIIYYSDSSDEYI